MNLFDIILIILLLWGAYKGFRRGFIGSLGGILSWIISLTVALSYNRTFAEYLDKQYGLSVNLGQWIAKIMPLPNLSFKADTVNLAIASAGVQEMALPDFLKKILLDHIEQILETTQAIPVSLSEIIGMGLAGMFIKGLSFLILFILTGLLVKFIIHLLNNFFGLTFLGPINRLFGMFLGLIINGLIITLVLGILSPMIFTSGQGGSTVSAIIHSSLLFNYSLDLFTVISDYVFGLI